MRILYLADGQTNSFNCPFKFFDPKNLIVTVNGLPTEDFGIEPDEAVGANIIFAAPYPAGTQICISRDLKVAPTALYRNKEDLMNPDVASQVFDFMLEALRDAGCEDDRGFLQSETVFSLLASAKEAMEAGYKAAAKMIGDIMPMVERANRDDYGSIADPVD